MQIPKWIPVTILIVALIGFSDAAFLTVEHYLGLVPPCSILGGCEKVTTSSYSNILGIPVALMGALYYLAVIILSILYLDFKKHQLIKVLCAITPLAFLFSLWFTYLQFFVIKALCPYCLFSALVSTVLFIIAAICWFRYLRIPHSAAPIAETETKSF